MKDRVLVTPPLGNEAQKAHQDALVEADKADAIAVFALHAAPQAPSTPFAPSWPPPPRHLGQIVAYVMPDESVRPALVLRVAEDGLAILNVQVALSTDERIQRQQYAQVPFSGTGEPGTWHEAPA